MIVTSPISSTSKQLSQTDNEKTDAQQKSDKLGKTDFLTLLVAQIKAQDPMNPMENTEFTAQMAQFSSLEQLFNVNENLAGVSSSVNTSTSVSALNMIGREVTAEGHNVEVTNGKASDISFTMPKESAGGAIVVADQGGNVVRTIEQGSLEAGQHNVPWDGLDDNGNVLEDGLYNYTVLAEDAAGDLINAQTFTRGTVTGVSFEDDITYIFVGDAKYLMGDIREVHSSLAAA